MKQFVKSALIILIFSSLTRVLAFVYRVFLAKQIGAEGLGIYQIVISVFFVLVTLTSSGIPVTISRKSAAYIKEGDYKSHFNTVKAGLYFNFLLAVGLSLLIFLFRDWLKWIFADPRCMNIFLILLPAFIFSSIYSSCRGGLWGEKRFFAYSFVECLEEVMLFVFGLILLTFATDTISKTFLASVAITIACGIAAFVSLLFFLRKKSSLKLPKGYVLPLIKSSAPITAIRLVSTLLTMLIATIVPSRLIAGGMAQSEALANFGIFSGMMLPILYVPCMVVGVLGIMIVPEFSTIKKDAEKLKKSMEFSLLLSVLAACIFIPIFLVMGEEICLFLFDNAFAGELLKKAAPFMVFLCISQISTTMLNSLGLEMQTMRNFFFAGGALLICAWFLPKYIGINALLAGYVINFIIQSVLNIISLKRKAGFSLKSIFPILIPPLACVPATLFCEYFSNLLSMFMPNVLTMVLCMLASVVFVLLLFLIFSPKRFLLHKGK